MTKGVCGGIFLWVLLQVTGPALVPMLPRDVTVVCLKENYDGHVLSGTVDLVLLRIQDYYDGLGLVCGGASHGALLVWCCYVRLGYNSIYFVFVL